MPHNIKPIVQFVLFTILTVILAAWQVVQAADPTQTPAPTATLSTTPVALSVTGTVTSGTGGVNLPAGLVVTLHLARSGPGGKMPAEVLKRDATLGADNGFRFDNVIAMPGDIAFITTMFEGVVQGSPLVQIPNDQRNLNLSATVYAPTNEPSVLSLIRAQHILDFLPGKTMQILATHTYKNTSDRLFVSTQKTAAGLPISVTIPLPVGARAIAFSTQPAARFAIGGDPNVPIVMDTKPVLPGQAHEIVFSYQVPFDGSAPIDQDFPYSTAAVEILVPDDSRAVIDSSAFTRSADNRLNPNRAYTQYVLKTPLKAGERLKYTLAQTAQPLPSPASQRAQAGPNLGQIIILALVLLLLAGIGWVVFQQMTRGRNRKRS